MRDEIFEQLTEIFRDVFDDDSIELTDDTCADDIDEWDSLMHITLIGTIEAEYDIKFPMKDVVGMKNVGELVEKIMELTE